MTDTGAEHCFAVISREIENLQKVLRDLEGTSAGSAVADPLRERVSHLVHDAIAATAHSERDLASKAALVLRWMDPGATDLPHLLCASLCRDVALMFPQGLSDGT